MDLDPGPVGSELARRHAPFLPDPGGPGAIGGQGDLNELLARLTCLPGQQEQPPRGLARLHAPGAFPSAGEKARAEVTAQAQVALYLTHPAGEAARIGECRPQVLDIGVEAVFHAHDALAVRRAQAAQDARARTCVAGHLMLPRARLPRGPPMCGRPAVVPDVVPQGGRVRAL